VADEISQEFDSKDKMMSVEQLVIFGPETDPISLLILMFLLG